MDKEWADKIAEAEAKGVEVTDFEKRLLEHPELVERIQAGIDSDVRIPWVKVDLDSLP